ncbi:DUF3180 domain-containing protein [Actinoplanes solisilvae]|uniref:DUF3180 domain-containing protein n=1 Tax=Actinoplanes solisilvae TaxID=2486853 RepID=UPI000FDA4BEB|nr:DUF3180 domain-containing protein [Actinoplanes solisilvae]
MRPTSISVLIVVVLVAAAVGWLLLSAFYETLPPLPWSPVVVLAALAIAEGLLAQNTWARIRRRKPGTPPVDPLAVARYVALAKASSLLGALFTGFSAGVLIVLLMKGTVAAGADRPAAIATVVSALVLIGAALWLERACRVPKQPDSKDKNDLDRPSGLL